MSWCIMITGTNCSGKTTLAKELISRFGGIQKTLKDRTICVDSRAVFLGKYSQEAKHGGCDSLNETKILASICEDAIKQGAKYVFCEGSYLNTFGISLQKLIFSASNQLVVSLFANKELLDNRLHKRSGNAISQSILKKQELCIRSAKKWKEIGVPTCAFDVSKYTTKKIADFIIDYVCNNQTTSTNG